MIKEDLVKVYACAGALWSSFKIPATELEAKFFDNVWFSILKPYDINVVLLAFREYANTNDFCNIAKVGELCDKLTQIANGIWIDEEEVINEIYKAISYDKCKENFEELSSFAKEIVEHPAYLAKWSQSKEIAIILSNLRKKVHNKLEQRKFQKTLDNLALLGTSKAKRISNE